MLLPQEPFYDRTILTRDREGPTRLPAHRHLGLTTRRILRALEDNKPPLFAAGERDFRSHR